jgi:hypothetical protein
MEKTTPQHEPRFWWHWQNLKHGDASRSWLHGRVWLHYRPQGIFGIEWCIPTRSYHIELTIGGVEDQLRLSIGCGLFALYFNLEDFPILNRWRTARNYHGRETSISAHHWSLWWRIWHDESIWKSTTPKWRRGSFNIPDFFLGRAEFSKIDQPPVPVSIPMPEGVYQATVTFSNYTWKRPRCPFPRKHRGTTIDIAGKGIPAPGKGESSWDLEDSAFLSVGSLATTIPDAIADCVRVVLRKRYKYGGKDWVPHDQKHSH